MERGGKGAALNAGIPQSKNEILLLTDVRQVVAPDSLQALIDCFADPSVGAVSGELLIRGGARHDETDIGLYWRYESWIRNKLSAIDSIFGATGPLYALRRELAVPIPPDQLLDDVYLPLAAFFRGYRLIVEPAAHAYRLSDQALDGVYAEEADAGGELSDIARIPAVAGSGEPHVVPFRVL